MVGAKVKRVFYIMLLFLSMFTFSFSEIILRAESNYTSLSEPIRIAVEFVNTDKTSYDLEGVENFGIMGRVTRKNYTVVNYRRYATLVDIYQLRPLNEGVFRIRVKRGREYSNTIEIAVGRYPQQQRQGYTTTRTVNQGGNSGYSTPYPQQQQRVYMGDSDDFKIAESLQKKSIYLGEKTIYSEYFRAYGLLKSFEYKERPKFENISSVDFTPINSDKTVIKREYTENGRKVIELTLYRGVVQGNLSGEQSFYTGQGEVVANSKILIPSRKVKLNVKPLPEEGKPENFQVIVGDPKNDYKWNDKEQEVGKTVLLTLKINGNVNLDGLEKLNYPESEDYNVYTTLKSSKEEIKEGKYYAEKLYEVAFIPKKSGVINIPDYTVNYFNPKTEKYESFTITGKTLNVIESKGGVSNGDVADPAQNQGQLQAIKDSQPLAQEKDTEKPVEITPEISIIENLTQKGKLNYWLIGLGVALLLQTFIMIKGHIKKKKFSILKSEENPLEEMKRAKTDQEFYDKYLNLMVKKYNFNPKLHSEIRLKDEKLKEINRVLEEWKFKGTPFNRAEIMKELETLFKEEKNTKK